MFVTSLLLCVYTNKTKLMIINTPSNPTGAIFDADILHAIAQMAQVHDLVILSDEPYEHILFDGHQHISIGSFEMTFLLSAFSSALYKAGINMERWRAGMKKMSLDVHDLHFSYLDGGSGEVLLLIHGFGANKDSWNRFARHFTDNLRVIAVDLND